MRPDFTRVIVLTTVLAVASTIVGLAQPGRPKAVVTATGEPAALKAGTTARVSLKVTLPADVHVQSDKPRDPALIPTVLTVDVPAGVVVSKIVYPTPTDLAQAGQKQPLAVFGPTFAIGVELALAKNLPAGDVTIPARLRYQACDARACYPPARAEAQWTLTVR